jgi:hypothetical protein
LALEKIRASVASSTKFKRSKDHLQVFKIQFYPLKFTGALGFELENYVQKSRKKVEKRTHFIEKLVRIHNLLPTNLAEKVACDDNPGILGVLHQPKGNKFNKYFFSS